MVVYATEELAKTKAEATELKNKYDAIKVRFLSLSLSRVCGSTTTTGSRSSRAARR